MSQLRISVIIPTYNRASLLPRALDSALAEAREGDEIIVVDDGSTDDTADVVCRYGGRARYLPVAHAGAGAARNAGIDAAANPLIAFLDSDDEWLPGKLRLQRAVFAHWPPLRLCFSDFDVCNREGVRIRRYLSRWHHDSGNWAEALGPERILNNACVHIGDLYPLLMRRPYVATFTAMVRQDASRPLPRFPVDLRTYEDWQFFGAVSGCGPSAFLDCETAIQHGHELPRLTDAGVRVRAEARIRVLQRVWGADPEFLQVHEREYEQLLSEQRECLQVATAREFLKSGDTISARAILEQAGSRARVQRWLSRLPGKLASLLVGLRDLILP